MCFELDMQNICKVCSFKINNNYSMDLVVFLVLMYLGLKFCVKKRFFSTLKFTDFAIFLCCMVI